MAIQFTPRELIWRKVDTAPKFVTFFNDNADGIWLEIPASTNGPASDGSYYWGAVPRTWMGPGSSTPRVTLQVSPPRWSPALPPQTRLDNIPFRITNGAGAVVQTGSIPCRNDAVSSVNFGQLQISAIAFDPAGNDLDGEGEYVELTNIAGGELNLAGCHIRHLLNVQSPGGSSAFTRAFPVQPDPVDFGRTSRLQPFQTVRVLSRAKRSNDPVNHPLRFYLGSNVPLLNNVGDRVTVVNADGAMVATHGYGIKANDPNYYGPTQPPAAGPAPHLAFSTRISVPGTGERVPVTQLQDGDIIDIVTDEPTIAAQFLRDGRVLPGTVGVYPFSPEYLPSGRGLLILPRRLGPISNDTDNPKWPAPGFAKYGLFAEVANHGWSIGPDGLRAQAIALDRPAVLELGINDDVRWDNRGQFIVQVNVYRN